MTGESHSRPAQRMSRFSQAYRTMPPKGAGRAAPVEPAESVLHRADGHSGGPHASTPGQRFAAPEPYADVIEVEFETVPPMTAEPDFGAEVMAQSPWPKGDDRGHLPADAEDRYDPLQPPPPDMEAIATALAAEMDRSAARNLRQPAKPEPQALNEPREDMAALADGPGPFADKPADSVVFASVPEREMTGSVEPQAAPPAWLDISVRETIARTKPPAAPQDTAALLDEVLPREDKRLSPNAEANFTAATAFVPQGKGSAPKAGAFPPEIGSFAPGAGDFAPEGEAFSAGSGAFAPDASASSPEIAAFARKAQALAPKAEAFTRRAEAFPPDAAAYAPASEASPPATLVPGQTRAQKAAALFASATARISPLARQAAHYAHATAAPAAIKAGFWVAHNLRRKEIRRRYGKAISMVHSRVLDRRLEQHFFVPTLKAQRFSPDPERAILYEGPVPAAAFNWALSAVPEDLREYAFVDFRAGLGRAMLLASQRKFERILGYEYEAAPYDDLQMNIAQFPRSKMVCRDIECFRGDRTGVSIPDQPCVLYFANAWREEFLSGIMTYLGESYRHKPRRLYVMLENVDEKVVLPKDDIFYRLELPLAEKLKLRLLSPMDFQVYRTLV